MLFRRSALLVAALTVTAGALVAPSPAGATLINDPGVVATDTSTVDVSYSGTDAQTTTTAPVTDSACVTLMKSKKKATDGCTTVETTSVTAATPATSSDLATIAAATDTSSTTAATSSLATTSGFYVLCKTWSMTMHAYTNIWGEKHVGKMCYGGGDVYVFNSWGGYHTCDLGWGVGWDVVVKYCNPIIKVYDANTYGGYFRQNWDRFKVYYGIYGSPISMSKDMHTNVFPNGTITFHHSD